MYFLQISPILIDTIKKITHAAVAQHAAHTTRILGPWDAALIPAYISAAATITVLVGTIVYDRRKTLRDERRTAANARQGEQAERRKKLMYFAAIVKPIIGYSDDAAVKMLRFATAIEKDPVNFPLLGFAPKSDLEKWAKRIEEEPFFHSFTSQYQPHTSGVRAFKKITAALEFQNLQMDQILQMIEIGRNHDYERRIKFSLAINAATAFAANSIANGSIKDHPNLLDVLNNRMDAYLRNRKDGSDLRYAYDGFVNPVIEEISSKGFFVVPVGLEIANRLHEASATYHEIQGQLMSLREDILSIRDTYIKNNEALKIDSERLLADFFEGVDNQ